MATDDWGHDRLVAKPKFAYARLGIAKMRKLLWPKLRD